MVDLGGTNPRTNMSEFDDEFFGDDGGDAPADGARARERGEWAVARARLARDGYREGVVVGRDAARQRGFESGFRRACGGAAVADGARYGAARAAAARSSRIARRGRRRRARRGGGFGGFGGERAAIAAAAAAARAVVAAAARARTAPTARPAAARARRRRPRRWSRRPSGRARAMRRSRAC